MVKNLPASVGDSRDMGLITGLGRSPGVGNGNPLQYSCLENPMDRGTWWAHGHEELDLTERLTHKHIFCKRYIYIYIYRQLHMQIDIGVI